MKKVIIYSTPTCPWCTKVKDYLDSKDVAYEDFNVSQDREKAMEMVNKSGQQGVPVIDIDGDIVVGFDQNNINRLLGL
jgi:glutaredoxin-like YruB-family protein